MPYTPLLKILIYVLDDDKNILKWIEIAFEERGITNYVTFFDKDVMLQSFNDDVQIVIIDYDLKSEMSGVDVMRIVKERQPLCTAIFMSSSADEDALIDIMNAGCNRFIKKDKPDFLEKLIKHVTEAAVEWDARLRQTLKAAARINETIEYFENFRKDASRVL